MTIDKDVSPSVQACIEAFKNGNPVLVFDSAFREKETDLLFPARNATPENIRRLRKDCGGLLFLAIGDEVGEMFDLPFLQDLHTDPKLTSTWPVLQNLKTNDLQYDTKSAFTLTLNHRDTYTGITDKDRSLTTTKFSQLVQKLLKDPKTKSVSQELLGKEFRTPGHIPLCRETKDGLKKRQGHTELAVSLAKLANLDPCVIGAEMLQPNGDNALTVEEAKAYGVKNNIPFTTGEELKKAFELINS